MAPRKVRRPSAYRYLLGDSRRESARLRRQSALWDPTAHALFDRLGVGPGWKILEIGPGQGSLHLELRRRTRGPVDAVERSPAFAARLAKLCARDGRGAGRIWNCDLNQAALPRARYDLIFARWVFLFLPDPEAQLRLLVRALKPGGFLAIEDYHRESFAMIPAPPEWADFLSADRAFFASEGGEVSIGGKLPALFRKVGLRGVAATPTIRAGHPSSAVWNWLSDYFLGVLDRYARFAPFSRAKARRLRRHWLRAAKEGSSFMIAPALVDVVGRKPR